MAAVEISAAAPLALVRQYLEHFGYADTLGAMESQPHGASPGADGNGNGAATNGTGEGQHGLLTRARCRAAILAGDVDGAKAVLRSDCPSAVDGPDSSVRFVLAVQEFVELVRQERLDEAVQFARDVLSTFRDQGPAQDAALREVLALLAYRDPGSPGSPVAPLLSVEFKEHVADVVNARILRCEGVVPALDGHPPLCSIDLLLKQLVATRDELRGAQGEVFSLQTVLAQGTS